MKAVIQRVSKADVTVNGSIVGSCENGYLILFCSLEGDTDKDIDVLAQKTVNLRIFCDENDKMNKSILDVDGEILVISQFTLAADTKKGNRPSFIKAMEPVKAEEQYNTFCEKLKELGVKKVAKGVFGEDMAVNLTNDGPVTILYDTEIWRNNGN